MNVDSLPKLKSVHSYVHPDTSDFDPRLQYCTTTKANTAAAYIWIVFQNVQTQL